MAALAEANVIIGARPLDIAGGLYVEGVPGGFLDVNNIELLHEQAFYLDAKGGLQNIGFASNGLEVDANFPANISSYRFEQAFTPSQSFDSLLTSIRPSFGASSYNFIRHSCQHFTDTIRRGLQ